MKKNKVIRQLHINVDGSCNNNSYERHTYTGIAVTFDGHHVSDRIKATYHGDGGTSNEAEYLAIIEGLKLAWQISREYKVDQLYILTDSKLAYNHIHNKRAVHTGRLIGMKETILKLKKELEKDIRIVNIAWIPRDRNPEADKNSKIIKAIDK